MPGETAHAPILIAGGGIGGLTAAVALRQAGLPASSTACRCDGFSTFLRTWLYTLNKLLTSP